MPDWTPLHAELALWRRAGLTLPVWWRDDDAVRATPELEQLHDIAAELRLPVQLAVIPDKAERSLSRFVDHAPWLTPVVHGWRHTSHAPQGAKNAEFGHPRDGAGAELARALRRAQDIFGPRLTPLFVPPWNRIAADYLPVLADLGYAGVSAYGGRDGAWAVPGLVQINTHVDPINWRGDRNLVAPEALIGGLVDTLERRRKGHADVLEPLGLLTHHLVHSEAIWRFTYDILSVLLDGGAQPADIGAALAAGRTPDP